MQRPKVSAACAGAGIAACIGGLLTWEVVAAPPAKQGPNPALQAQFAQIRPKPRGDQAAAEAGAEDAHDGVFRAPDRDSRRRLKVARDLLDKGQFGESVRILGQILADGSEDFFFKTDPNSPVFRSLKAEAARLIAELPSEGRKRYEEYFGHLAEKMLNQAVANHDMAQLAEASRRYFHTSAGSEATFLLARDHFDHDRVLAAALLFDRVRGNAATAGRFEPMLSLSLATCWFRAGMPEKAQAVLVEFKKTHGQSPVRIGAKQVPVFGSDAQAVGWLSGQIGPARQTQQQQPGQWTMFRGNPQRNAAAAGGLPLMNLRWRQRVAADQKTEELINQTARSLRERDTVLIPAMHPLTVGRFVLMRTTNNLRGIDFTTGKAIWQYPPQMFPEADDAAPQERTNRFGWMQQVSDTLDQRVWDDLTSGTLSSDGETIYSVENRVDNRSAAGQGRTTVLHNGARRITAGYPRTYNYLAALSLAREGACKWTVGGADGDREPKLAGAYFLGPPLPLQGRLYALAEMKSQEIRLVVLSAKTGALEWSQELATPEQSVVQDPFRRHAGLSPSFADGVLVCPTAAGAVVAIDLTSRTLLWGYQYARNGGIQSDRMRGAPFGPGPNVYLAREQRPNDRWMDSSVTLADSHAIVAPVDSEALYCLNLLDGQLQWSRKRDKDIYVACVDRDRVVLVGHNRVTTCKLADGENAVEIPLGQGVMPSGRGFHSDGFYYLPLTSAEVAKIDIAAGRIESRAKSRNGSVPGNLISYQGEVVSLSPNYLEKYSQVDTLRQRSLATLKEHPDDPQALADLGEIKREEGDLAEAIALLRRSYAAAISETTRDLLVGSLLDGLRFDYATYREHAQELEKLINQDSHRVRYLRLSAVGLQKSGEIIAALDATLKVADVDLRPAESSIGLPPVGDDLEILDETHEVRRDRWVQGRLAQLMAAAKAAERQQLDSLVSQRIQKALEANSTKSLRKALALYGCHPASDVAREKLVALLGGERAIEREQLLHAQVQSTDAARVPGAVARLAQLYGNAQRPDLAANYYRQLTQRWADIVCLDGKTGQQLVDELPAAGAVRTLLAGTNPWPVGIVKTSDNDEKPKRRLSPTRQDPLLSLELRGQSGPIFSDTKLLLEPQQRWIAGQDGLGKEWFRVDLNLAQQQSDEDIAFRPGMRQSMHHDVTLNHARANGHLLVVALGGQVVAIDTLRGRAERFDEAASRVLWTHELKDEVLGLPNNQGVHAKPSQSPWGPVRYFAQDSTGRPLGSMGPVTAHGVCLQRWGEIVCVDPLSGETVWIRKNIPPGCEIFADDEVTIVAPPDGADALVLRTLDGELLARRRVPPREQRMTTIGRTVLSWQMENGKPVMKLEDPWKEHVIWTRSFEAKAKAALVRDEAVGALEPSSDPGDDKPWLFSLINLADGKPLVDKEPTVPSKNLANIYVLRTRDQWLLLTTVPPGSGLKFRNAMPVPTGLNSLIVNGNLLAFDRATGKLQWGPIKIAQHGLFFNQPNDSPVLVFVRNLQSPGSRDSFVASIMCIDKRTGRTVYVNESLQFPTPIRNFEVALDPADKLVSLLLPGKTIAMTLTDEPLPAEPSAENSASAKTGGFGALGAIIKALGEGVKILPVVPAPVEDEQP